MKDRPKLRKFWKTIKPFVIELAKSFFKAEVKRQINKRADREVRNRARLNGDGIQRLKGPHR